jgi:hypothetical protein
VRRIIAWVARFWTSLRKRARRYAEAARELLPRREPAATTALPAPPGRRRFSRLSARERVVYYFLSIVERLERQGRRRPSQTALELEAEVGPSLGEASVDMRDLTASYLEARYSAHPMDNEEAERAKGHWQRVRAALRRKHTAEDGEAV